MASRKKRRKTKFLEEEELDELYKEELPWEEGDYYEDGDNGYDNYYSEDK